MEEQITNKLAPNNDDGQANTKQASVLKKEKKPVQQSVHDANQSQTPGNNTSGCLNSEPKAKKSKQNTCQVGDFKNELKECQNCQKKFVDLHKHLDSNVCSNKGAKKDQVDTSEDICKGCGKSFKRLQKHLNGKSGSKCKEQFYFENVQMTKQKAFYERNKIRLQENKKEYDKKNTEKRKEYYQKNKEKLKEDYQKNKKKREQKVSYQKKYNR